MSTKLYSSILLLLFLITGIQTEGIAQKSESISYEHQRHITLNPLVNNLFSYEEAGKIFIEQKKGSLTRKIFELICGDTSGDFGDFSTEWGISSESSSESCSHLDWRPVFDSYGKLWFAYIHNENNTIKLGYLDESLNCESSGKCDSFTIDMPGLDTRKYISRPKWSPDGQNLLFQKGEDIWIMYDIQDLLNDRNRAGNSTKKLTKGSFFDWSPDQRFISFETLNDQSPDVGIILVNEIASNHSIDTRFIGTLLNRENERFKPSWSPDGKILAYQVEGFQPEYWAVKLLGVDNEGASIQVSEVTEGRNFEIEDFFKSNDERNGPEIVNFRRNSYPEDPNTYSFIVYVSADQSMQRPVKVHSIDRGLAIPPDRIKKTPNNDYVAANGIDGSLNIAYASQADHALRLTFDEIDLSSQFASPPHFVPREIRDRRAVALSSAFPGLGQFYKKDPLKGITFATATAGLGGILGYNIYKGRSNSSMNVAAGLLGGLYAINLIESTSGFTRKDQFHYSALVPGLGQIMRGDYQKGGIIFGASAGLVSFLGYNSYHNRAYSPLNISVAVLLAGTYSYNIYDGVSGLPKVIGMNPDVVQVNIGMEHINLQPERRPIPVLRLIF